MREALKAARSWEEQGFFIFSSLNESDVMAQAEAADKRFAAGGVRCLILYTITIAFMWLSLSIIPFCFISSAELFGRRADRRQGSD
jgi:hypothetical protein